MSTYKFSNEQRYAIFLVHDRKCYLCKVPLDFISMVVDHVVPEHLLQKPSLFQSTLSALGLPKSFDLNSFKNWLPACNSCNTKKSGLQFEPSLLIQVELQNLAKKARKARKLCDEIVSKRKLTLALSVLMKAVESGETFDDATLNYFSPLLKFALERKYLLKGQPLCLTQTFRLVTTTVQDAARWGATHWSTGPREPGEPVLVVLFRAEQEECAECGVKQQVFQPINQEGGGDAICGDCISKHDWMDPVALGDLPTHVTSV